ncbi:MAG: radical SAM protein, partial [Planctomycetes bacterium]|nr:radical SAM protein [Planctomycetota bacterium]
PQHKIAFVINRLGFQEVLSIPLVSALAKERRHATALFEYAPRPAETRKEIAGFAPDIVAYSVCSNEAERYLQINRELKDSCEFFSLFGGPHPTFFPRFVEADGVDAICRGEADLCFGRFLDLFGTGQMYAVSNFSFKMPGGQIKENPLADLAGDLDAVPFPDRGLLYEKNRFMARNPIKVFMAGRGCPYQCSYCFNHLFNGMYRGKGKILRIKSVNYLIREIRQVAEKYPLTFVKFHDDVFGSDGDWLAEFADRFPKEVGLPFFCYARPNMISDHYCRLLKAAGCYSVSMAIESGNEKLRTAVLNRKVTNEQIVAASRHLREAGIRIYTLNMIGLPGETEKEIFETIELNQIAGSDFADASILQPYPGTQLTEYCKQTGYLDDENCRFESQFSESTLNFDEKFKNKLFVLHRLFPLLVDRPGLKRLLGTLYRTRFLNGLLNVIYRSYYGRHVHGRIYAGKIPFTIRLRGAVDLLLSKGRI